MRDFIHKDNNNIPRPFVKYILIYCTAYRQIGENYHIRVGQMIYILIFKVNWVFYKFCTALQVMKNKDIFLLYIKNLFYINNVPMYVNVIPVF